MANILAAGAMTAEPIELGPLRVAIRPDSYPWHGSPAAGGPPERGNARVASVTGPGGVAVDVAVVQWAESREVATLDCYGSPPRIQRLGRGGRIGIRTVDEIAWMELRISRLTSAEWSSEFQTSEDEVTLISRLPFASTMLALGADGVGPREVVLGESGRRRRELAVTFDAASVAVPIAAYCCVRILPLLYQHGLEGAGVIG